MRLLPILLVAVLLVPLAGAAPWERADARLPRAPEGAAVIAAAGAIYVFGGVDTDGDPLRDILRYDLVADEVRLLDAVLPEARADLGAVWDGQHVLLIGGRGPDGEATRHVFRFDPFEERIITMVQALPEARAGLFGVQARGGTYIMGGAPCDPCEVLRLGADGVNGTGIMLPGAHGAAYWDGSDVHVLADGQMWRFAPGDDAATALGALPFRGPVDVAYDGLHGHAWFAADAQAVWRISSGLQRLGPELDTPGPPMHMVAAGHLYVFGAGVGAAAEQVGIARLDPMQAHVPVVNAWCTPLGRDPCDVRVPSAGAPWLPFLGGVFLFVYLGAAAMSLRIRADGGPIPEQERDRWIAVPALAVLALLVLTFQDWALVSIGEATALLSPAGLHARNGGPWWDVPLPRTPVLVAGLVLWIAALLGAATATGALGLRRRRVGARIAAAAGGTAALAWTVLAAGIHVVADGAALQWRAPVLVAFVAVIAFGMGVFMLLRHDTPEAQE